MIDRIDLKGTFLKPALHASLLSRSKFTLTDSTLPLPDDLLDANPKRQLDFLSGRTASQYALNKISDDLKICNSLSATGIPVFPNHIVGSISHTKEYVIALLGLKTDFLSIGCDIETIVPLNRANKLKHKILTETDLKILNQAQSDKSFNEIFSAVFSAKEAIYKCVFPLYKKFFGFHDFHLTNINTEQLTFTTTNESVQKYLHQSQIIIHYTNINTHTILTYCVLAT